MNNIKNNNLIKILYLCIPLINFTILKKGGFRGVMVLEIIALLIIIRDFKKILQQKTFLLINILLILPWLLYPLIIDFKEFIFTYVTLIFYIILLIVISKNTPKFDYIRAFIIGTSIVAIYGIIQFIITNLGIVNLIEFIRKPFGNTFTFSVLPISYSNGLMRVNSLFYEPSIFGTYCIFGYALCITFQQFNKPNLKLLFITGIIISFSATAYIGFGAILLVRILMLKGNILIKYITTIPIILCIVILFNFLIGDRISEVVHVGSSTYYRFIAPLKLIDQIIFKEGMIIGLPLGQIEKYIILGDYSFMMNGLNRGTSIDNAIAVIVLYTGIFSFGLAIFTIIKFKKYFLKNNVYLFISIIVLIFTTGGINFIYFNVLLCIFVQSIKLNNYSKDIDMKYN